MFTKSSALDKGRVNGMDWNALGTWAAVVVALAISLKDTFQRWRERTAPSDCRNHFPAGGSDAACVA